jgi:RNA polymerase sigma-70 factor, ECF subfamily
MKNKREFRKVFNNCYTWVFNWAFSKTGSSEDAEDICQEVFIRLYKNFHKVDPLKRWGWLKTAVRYELSSYIRKKGKTDIYCAEISSVDENRLPAARDEDILPRIILEELIEDESNYADEEEKIIFRLMGLYRYTAKEAAREIGLTERKTRYRYLQVTRKILNKLKSKNISNIEDIL